MANEQILKKALEKAYKNGWTGYYKGIEDTVDFHLNDCERPDVSTIIFSHDFAKAFWGEGKKIGKSVLDGQEYEITLPRKKKKYFNIKNWQYHLQQMVLEKEPLKYLEKFL